MTVRHVVLPPADRLVYEEHLAQCASCEREVCGLAGLRGLLSRVPEAWAVRRRRLVVMAATVLVAAMTGAVLGVLFFCYL
ncbi:hypothetical protein AB0M48_02265 [Lentzea sp. NPDC051208]|uniref:hypothetical protein n=1 Tax=Lentzea sp. NPDC051208 TaxID=3154642 RepID=UPI00342E6130